MLNLIEKVKNRNNIYFENTLEIDSVVHNYEDKKVLANVFLKCSTGDIIGLFGLNGCGKSTLLKIIFGTLKADFQNIRFNSKRYEKLFKQKNSIALMNQISFLPSDLKVKNCIKMYIKNKNLQKEIISDERINKFKNSKISLLSGGEKRYLEFLLIMNLDTKFVLLDEPFSEIEPLYQKKLKDIIKEKSKTKGIILTDHNYQNILDVSNKNILIKNGLTIEINNSDDLKKYGYTN